MSKRLRPAVLLLLDGFGIAADNEGNAIARAKTPFFDVLKQKYPVMALKANGEAVGLGWGEMGNSEVGHLTIGSGRAIFQLLPRINRAIEDGSFYENERLLYAIQQVKATGGTLHVMGICSSGNVHGSNKHIEAVLALAKAHGIGDVAVHVILDGRDSLYNSGVDFVEQLEAVMKAQKVGYIATLSGRFYAMDRDNRWDRVEAAYKAIALGESEYQFATASLAIEASYRKEVYDEEFVPAVIVRAKAPKATVKPGDAMIFTNFRADRAREITKAFTMPVFPKFKREYISNLVFVAMAEYEAGLPVHVAFPPEVIDGGLSQTLSEAGLVQLHIGETEKYAHVTFFFNGTREQPFPHEDRVIIASPNVTSYDQKPEMATYQITDRILKEIETSNYDVIIANFANPDMVAHTGNMPATIKAIESVDDCVEKIVTAVLKKNGCVLITADHGNAEEVKNLQTGEMDKEHSTNPVPFYVIAKHLEGIPGPSGDAPNGDLSLLPPIGMLADVAPTMLALLGIDPPEGMTGHSLI